MAKKVIVKIPNVTEEVRIGYSFNYMIKVMAETEAADDVQWDFADVTFLHPFFLAPLAIYKNTSGKDIECINISLRIQSYLNSVKTGQRRILYQESSRGREPWLWHFNF